MEKSWADEGRPQLCIDDWLEVHWRDRMIVRDCDFSIYPAQFSITRFGMEPDEVQTYATIDDLEDQDWLRQAAGTAKMIRTGSKIDPGHLGRLHAILDRNGRMFYQIELLTGVDYQNALRAERAKNLIMFVHEQWLLIGVGAAVLWWWFS